MRICSKCKVEKEENKFYGKHPHCSECHKARRKLAYKNNREVELKKRKIYVEKNRDKVLEYSRRYNQSNKEYDKENLPNSIQARYDKKLYVWNYLKENPCVKCGEPDPIVLEFNHIDPKQKFKGVAELAHNGTFEQLETEIKKCEVMCANCHKRHTAVQLNWMKAIKFV